MTWPAEASIPPTAAGLEPFPQGSRGIGGLGLGASHIEARMGLLIVGQVSIPALLFRGASLSWRVTGQGW